MRNPAGLFKNRPFIILTAVLACQAVVLYGFSRSELVPLAAPLSSLSQAFGPWTMIAETPLEKEVLEVLRADDTINRTYADGRTAANLFIAYFKSQRAGQAPHSPKNCLPGAGWVPVVDDTLSIDIPGQQPIRVNHYIIQNTEQKSVVLYWYQSHGRVVASEYTAKFWVVADALRYNRTDTALVRVVMPAGQSADDATASAVRFIQASFPAIRQHLNQ